MLFPPPHLIVRASHAVFHVGQKYKQTKKNEQELQAVINRLQAQSSKLVPVPTPLCPFSSSHPARLALPGLFANHHSWEFARHCLPFNCVAITMHLAYRWWCTSKSVPGFAPPHALSSPRPISSPSLGLLAHWPRLETPLSYGVAITIHLTYGR